MQRPSAAAWLLLWLCLACVGCGPAASAPLAQGSCRYDVELRDAQDFVLDVELECDGPEISGLRSTTSAAAPFIEVRSGRQALARDADLFRLETPTRRLRLSYQVRLGELARQQQDFDLALIAQGDAGRGLVSPAYTWLLEPDPLPAGLPVSVQVRVPEGAQFATGLSALGAGAPAQTRAQRFELVAQEIQVATYSAFGQLQVERLEFPPPISCRSAPARACAPGVLEVVTLPRAGAAGAQQPTAVSEWIRRSAAAVAEFWGGFPVAHASLIVIPVADRDEVVFGKVLPASAPAIALLVGEQADTAALNRDWILVHELFHLGVPSFSGEGKWLDEGLATYYEPLIRARAGNRTELEVWAELARNLYKGVDAMGSTGLERTRDFSAVYWGGALVSLLADVEARRSSAGRVGLEDGLREVLRRGGHASKVWPLSQVIRVVDGVLGKPVLGRLSERYGTRGAQVDLPGLLSRLGVDDTGEDTKLVPAPDAELRRQLLFPPR